MSYTTTARFAAATPSATFRYPLIPRAVYESNCPAGGDSARTSAAARSSPSADGSPASAIAHHVARTARQGDEAAGAVLRAAGDAAAARAPASVARWYAAGPSPPRGCGRRPTRPELEFAFGTLAM